MSEMELSKPENPKCSCGDEPTCVCGEDLPNNWHVEYEQLSEDLRQYNTVGWQVPVAVISADGAVISLSVLTHRLFIIGVILVLAGLLTVLAEFEMMKWQKRSKTRRQRLRCYDCRAGFRRYLPKETHWILNLPLGNAFVAFMLTLGFGTLLIGLFFIGDILLLKTVV